MDGPATIRREAAAAAARVLAAGGARGEIGVVLGTGLGGIVDRLADAVVLPMAASGWLLPPTATGHAGRIVCGRVGGRPVVALQGRVHAYEGFGEEEITRGVEFLAALGASTLLVTSASGGLRRDMVAGELLVLDDHVDFVRGGRASPPGGPRTPYAPHLVALALAAARAAGVRARPGVYARLLGPCYETRAEYRMLLRAGADAVGMSTVPEVLAARRLGLEVAAVSVVTNVATPDAPEETDAEEVCRLAATGIEGVWAVLAALAAEGRAAVPAIALSAQGVR